MTSAVHTPPLWNWINIWGVDHLYEHCPAYRRAECKRQGSDVARFHLPDPNGDVCGWCTRHWLTSNPDADPCPGPKECRLVHWYTEQPDAG